MGSVTNLWDRDPEKWKAMELKDKLEYLRKYYCTGPCGQSSAVLGARSALDKTLREAIQIIDERNVR
jgi:hypothetical protein